CLHDRDLRQRRRAAPAVHRQAHGAAHAGIVEGFSLVVRCAPPPTLPMPSWRLALTPNGPGSSARGGGHQAPELFRAASAREAAVGKLCRGRAVVAAGGSTVSTRRGLAARPLKCPSGGKMIARNVAVTSSAVRGEPS